MTRIKMKSLKKIGTLNYLAFTFYYSLLYTVDQGIDNNVLTNYITILFQKD
jgi:hypothetical protein